MIATALPWQIEALDPKRHDRAAFSCGVPELDRYLAEHASQDIKRDISRVFVAIKPDAATVCAYYSLSATNIRHGDLPAALAKKLPRYPVPAVLLGRLAIDRGSQGLGLGEFLLMDAMYRTLLATQVLALHSMLVDAKDDAAAAFYRKYGFISLPNGPQRLFIPVATMRQLVQS
jgi:ribosomal protein S18 acetylase RimI-like enzyme